MGEPAAVNLSGYRQTLGVCWLVYGIFRLIMGICLVLFGGKATVMFGALLGRVPNPFALMGDFHVIYAVIVVLTLLCGLFGFLAGLALLASQRLARTLALLAAFFFSETRRPTDSHCRPITLAAYRVLFTPFAGSPLRKIARHGLQTK